MKRMKKTKRRFRKHRNKGYGRLTGILLLLILVTGGMTADMVRAEGETDVMSDIQQESSEENEEKTEEKEEKTEEQGESGDKDEEKTEEPPPQKYVMPAVHCPEVPAGRSWYSAPPVITITHYDRHAVTKYTATNAENERKEDILKIEPAESAEANENVEEGKEAVKAGSGISDGETVSAVLEKEFWKEGENTLTVRMESMEGEELYRKDITISVDLSNPDQLSLEYSRPLKEGILYSASEFTVHAEAADTISGVEKIVYHLDEGREGVIEGEAGLIHIPAGYAGMIEAYAVDRSGRKGETVESAYIICEDQSPEIRLDAPDGLEAWYRDKVTAEVHVEEKQSSGGAASGIGMITCYIDKKIVMQETYEASEAVYDKTFQLTVSPDSQEGISEIAVHVTDRAGNRAVKYGQIHFDSEVPSLTMEGVYDTLISSGEVKAVFKVEDSGLSDASLYVRYTDVQGNSSDLINLDMNEWNKKENGISIEEIFEKDGKYECRVVAEDKAKNRVEKNIGFVIDSASPVIHYVDQMEGLTIPYFQWNYRSEDMIRDYSEYSYQISLNGKPYLPGSRITDEGVSLLVVRAVDAAGNQSLAEAVFEIDHTPPAIIWGDEMNEKIYRDCVTMSVWVDGAGERLRKAMVNGKSCRLSADSRIFQYDIEEPGIYHVQISAEDLAGNRSREEVIFTVKRRQSFVQNLVNPVIETVEKYTGRQTDPSVRGSEAENERNFPVCAAAVILAAVCLVPAGYYIVKKNKWENRVSEEKDP